jgi:hypothetical protein
LSKVVPRPIPTELEARRSLARSLSSNGLLVDRVVNAEGTQTMLWVQMATMADIDVKRDAIIAGIRRVCDARLPHSPHAMGGVGVLYSALNTLTQRDFSVFLSISYLVMFCGIYFVFRSVKIVIAALLAVGTGTYIALGIYGLAGNQMNMVTVVLPILIVILGLADSLHFPATMAVLQAEQPQLSRFDRVAAVLNRILLPCVFTTLTTVAGFLSLVSAPMKVIRDLGIYSSIGLLGALLASVIVMTVSLLALKERFVVPNHAWIDWLLQTSARIVRRRPITVTMVLFALTAAGAAGSFLVVNDTYTIGYLPKDDPAVRDHEHIVEKWGDYNVVDFIVRNRSGQRVDTAETVNAVERFVAASKQNPRIRTGLSLADVYRRIAQNLSLDKPASAPWTQDEIAQLNVLLSSMDLEWDRSKPAHDRNPVAPFMNESGQVGRLQLIGGMMSAMELRDILAELQEEVRRVGNGMVEIIPAGYPPLYVKIIQYVTESQVRSFFWALAIVFVIMLVMLRSLRLALISLPPNLFPVVLMLGAMGWTGIRLDIATATVAAIVLGMAIDDTVHYLHHWREAELQGKSWDEAYPYVLRNAGLPAVVTATLLIIGFPVLMLAQVKTLFYFGALTTFAAATAILGDLFMLPLLLKMWPARRAHPVASTKEASR